MWSASDVDLILVPGDGPAAAGDLQWLLHQTLDQWSTPSGHHVKACGTHEYPLPLPVHRDECA